MGANVSAKNEGRRLDSRLFNSKPYEMAMPTPRMMFIAYQYRRIVTVIQCVALAFSLFVFLRNNTLAEVWRWVAVALTGGYISIYVARLLPFGSQLEGRHWWLGQLFTGILEIALLGSLGILYANFQFEHTLYWWALYILPTFRLAETSGFGAWAVGLFLALVLLGAESWFCTACRDLPFWPLYVLIKWTLLFLSTFMPFYIFRLLDLSRQSARFWYPLASRFLSGSHNVEEGVALLEETFHLGLDNLIAADKGVLWQIDASGEEPVLRSVYEYERKRRVPSPWDRWIYLRKPGKSHSGNSVVPLGSGLQQIIASTSPSVLSIKECDPIELPWKVSQDSSLATQIVIPVSVASDCRPVGYLEVGLYWRFQHDDRYALDIRAHEVARTLGEVFERIKLIQAYDLQATLLGLERKAPEEASLYNMAVENLKDHFQRRVLIVEYSFESNKIEAVFGDWDPEKIDWIGKMLEEREDDLRQAGEINVCRAPGDPVGERVCLFACPLTPQGGKVDVIVLVDEFASLSSADQLALRESGGILNEIRARKRTTSLVELGDGNWLDTKPTRKRLDQLAHQINEEFDADVVVLYEFEAGRPKLPPIIVGQLNDPQYITERPIVIEEPNPILRVAKATEPQFFEDVQSEYSMVGTGKNRHGDDVFVLRENIRSSVSLPLRTQHGVVGVVWVNFRRPQRFGRMERQNYIQLFSHLPQQLESLRVIEETQSLAIQRTRDQLRADLHDRILQDIITAGGFSATVLKTATLEEKEAENLTKSINALTEAAQATRNLLDDLEKMSQETDMTRQLNQFAQRMQEEYGHPAELKMDGLQDIPPEMYRDLSLAIKEAIRNAAKHGHASRVAIQASRVEEALQLVIRDNGQGFDPRPDNFGHGICSMRSRVRSLGGKISIASQPEEGTGVVVEIPLMRER